jgi:putative transposase
MRRARSVIPGLPHHATQRGNRRSDVFLEAEDRHIYLELTREYFSRHGVCLWAYVLMTNHTHMIVVPETDSSLSKALRDVHGSYASIFNRKYGLNGHVWQARFYSCTLDDEHLFHAVRYVERNPVRAGMVARAEDYPWSSAGPHVLAEQDRYLHDGLPLIEMIENWSQWLATNESEVETQRIRDATSSGRACGSEDFITRLESACGRPLRRLKRGRKPHRAAGNWGQEIGDSEQFIAGFINCSLSPIFLTSPGTRHPPAVFEFQRRNSVRT